MVTGDHSAHVTATGVGEDVRFSFFGLPERVAHLGSAARAVIDRACVQAREQGQADVDLDELRAARAADGDVPPDTN